MPIILYLQSSLKMTILLNLFWQIMHNLYIKTESTEQIRNYFKFYVITAKGPLYS